MKIKVIINSRVNIKFLKEMLCNIKQPSEHLYNIEYTMYPHHAKDIAKRASENGYDIVLAVGGDGTVNDVINGIAGTDTALSIFPAGNANDFATYYNIERTFLYSSTHFDKFYYHYPDLINVNGIYYSTCGGIGLPAKVVNIANNIRKSLKMSRFLNYTIGYKLYSLSVICSIINMDTCNNKIFIFDKNVSFETNVLSLTFNNQSFLGSNIQMSPGAINNDGLFNVCLIEGQSSRIKVIDILCKIIRGEHESLPYVRCWEADQMMIRTEHICSFFGDGDLLCNGNEFHIKIIKNALKVLEPNSNKIINKTQQLETIKDIHK